MLDRCGKELKVGQAVDVYLDGRYVANVVEVSDGGITGTDGKPMPAKLLLIIPVPMRLNPGQSPEVYVVRDAPEDGGPTEEKKSERVM